MEEWYERQTIGALPARAVRQWGPREALAFQGRRWTFAELSDRVDAVAKGLLRLGIAAGDKVALWMVNRPEWLDAMFAVMKIGAVLVPVNARLRTDDMAYVLGQSDAVAMILAARSGPVDYLGILREVAPAGGAKPAARFPALRHVVVVSADAHPGTVAWGSMLEDGRGVGDDALRARDAAVNPAQPAFFFYTSGTTGFPKAAVHDHRIVRNTWDQGERMRITVDDVILMYLPLFHIFGFLHGALMSMIRGARQVLTETFDADECVELIERERATVIHGFDTHFRALLDAQDKNPRDVSSVRTGICGTGMSSAIPIARRARQTFGPLVTAYGMSEVGVPTFGFLDSRRSSASRRTACHFPAARCGSWTRTPAQSARRGRPARSSCAATRSCSATTESRRRRRAPSTRTAGSTPATWACCVPTGTCTSSAATRTC